MADQTLMPAAGAPWFFWILGAAFLAVAVRLYLHGRRRSRLLRRFAIRNGLSYESRPPDSLEQELTETFRLSEREVMEEGEVVIVNEAMAKRFWPGERAIGKRIRLSGGDSWQTVVGVAADVHEMDLAAPPEPQLYLPYSHNAWRTMSLAVRTRSSDPAAAIPSIRDAIQRLDLNLAHFEIATMEEVVDLSFWDRRLYGWMFSAFAAVALLLAAVGVYGVMAYTVARRTHEIGIRMALGAEARHVIHRVIGQGLRPVLLGLGLGLALAFGVTRVLAGFLYGVAPTDPLTFAGIALFLAMVALLACYIPARRATRVDPLAALRAE